MRVGEMCSRNVVTCGRDTEVAALAATMRENHVGDVIVVDASSGVSRPVGIVTDRDLVVKVLARGVDVGGLRAEDLSGGDLVTIYESETMYDAVWRLRSKCVRRLPVVDEAGGLVGVLTLDDVARFLSEELNALMRLTIAQADRERQSFVSANV